MDKQNAELAQARKQQVGTGDRSEKIRTYNFPQNRLTDHRIGLTLHQLDQVMEGRLQPIVDALITHYQAEQLKAAVRRLEVFHAFAAPSSRSRELTLKDGPHPERARRDAELLLMHLLKRSRAWLIAHNDELLADELSVSYTELLERRRKASLFNTSRARQSFTACRFL